LGKTHSMLSIAVKAICAGVIFASTLYAIWVVGPWLETRYFPAVGKLMIQQATEIDGKSVLHVAFRKLRDCEYIGIAWYRGQQGGEFTRVPIVLGRQEDDNSSPNRAVGFQFTGPWTVDVPMAELHSNSFALLQHRCHPAWLTTTEFYP